MAIIQPLKEEGSHVIYNMNGTWGFYAKWNKSDRKRQILYDLTYTWDLKKKATKRPNSEEPRVKWWSPEAEVLGKLRDVGQRVETDAVRWVSSGDLILSMVTVVNKTLLY